ncbi:aspartic peptidase A1 [Amanita muscaria]
MFYKFLSTLLLVLAVSANPFVPRDAPAKLSISRYLQTTGVYNVLKQDQARATHLALRIHLGEQGIVNEPATNTAVAYTASVGIGNPPTQYTLLIDTGSSNIWVGANKSYVRTSTSKVTKDSVSVSYGSGKFTGTEYIDTVTLGSIVIPNQSIGVASNSSGFTGIDGILGIGPVDLTKGTLSPDSSATIPTVTDNAFSSGQIRANKIGVSFEPVQGSSQSSQNGELTWGGVDYTKFIGLIHYAPLTSTSPASRYWGVDQTITYGSSPILSKAAGIVDTGTTLILIATDAFNLYQTATGGVLDNNVGLLAITPSQYSALKNLDFNINGKTYSLTPNAQIWPRSLNSVIGGSSSSIYLIVADMGTPTVGKGLDFINGQKFLERFYTVYDTANKQIGFAITPYTTATSN